MSHATIDEIVAREILDSRGQPTVEVDLKSGDSWHRASVPSGASTGSHEALELRDEDPKRFWGKGVLKCVQNISQKIAPEIIGRTFESPRHLDAAMIELDGTPNKAAFGANAILAVSMAYHRACAASARQTLFEYLHDTYFPNAAMIPPIPMMNVINGGKHADNPIQIQEFMICPHLDTKKSAIQDRVRAGAETYHHLKKLIQKAGYVTNVGDEGGFAPAMTSEREVLDVICRAIESAGYTVGTDISLAIDAASSEFYEDEQYAVQSADRKITPDQLTDFYVDLVGAYPAIVSLEDPFAEDDWPGWRHFFETLHAKHPDVMVVGDDLLVTNPQRLKKGLEQKTCNAILIKINQIGSISETADTMNMATEAGWRSVVSHRSGETEDSFISHLVTGSGAGWLKTGAPCRTDRNAKYNELLRIFK